MTFPFSDVSLLAVLGATIATMLVGFAWYSQLLFGKIWMREMEFDPNKANKGGMGKALTGSLIATLISTYVLALLVLLFAPVTLLDAMKLGCLFWISLTLPWELNHVLWEGRSWKLFLIAAANSFVTIHMNIAILRYFM